jgi:predicted adenine nucleotide alpha hydrolase (AANH) superfamily ATPase
MRYWSPLAEETEEWEPKGGWNRAFSEQDKLQCATLFFFFKNKKGYKERAAEILAHMVLFKQKYPGLAYTQEQEQRLREALQPICISP